MNVPKKAGKSGRGRGNAAATLHRQGPPCAMISAAVVLVLIAAAVFGYIAVNHTSKTAPSPPAGVQTFANLSRDHVTGPVNYPQIPPVGGPHNPVWLNCGIYTAPVPNEHAVHSLEHGAVWITYQPNLPAAQVAQITKTVGNDTYVIVSPYPGLPAPVVASAWGTQLKLHGPTDPRLAQFLAYYRQGPQTPEPGSPCTGGFGTPQTP